MVFTKMLSSGTRTKQDVRTTKLRAVLLLCEWCAFVAKSKNHVDSRSAKLYCCLHYGDVGPSECARQ